MRVVKRTESGVTAFETYATVVEELLKLPLRDGQLSTDELRRKCAYLSVLDYLEHHCVVPEVHQIPAVSQAVSAETTKSVIDFHGLGASSSKTVSQQDLAGLLDVLHSTYQLSQAELMQVADLGPTHLVDLYSLIEHCGRRYSEETLSAMLQLCQNVFVEKCHSTF